jgi:two-component system nitrogen regulation sensor histidine kinase NtrY
MVRSANHTASTLLGIKVGGKLAKASPVIHEAWLAFVANPRPLAQQQVKINATDGDSHTLLLRLVPQYVEGGKVGSVVATADDITPLIGAQRIAAWRDVARRLAHEIKNPLTPIKLSAERLQRKYLKLLPESDQPLFKELTNTIVQQAEDMRRMTNEFSDFARMPVAVFQQENLIDLVDQAVTLQAGARSGITFEKKYELKRDDAVLLGDRGQINRVLVNVLENAVNAIEESPQHGPKHDKDEKKTKPGGKGEKSDVGLVTLVVKRTHDGKLRVTVLDNGKGLPPEVDVAKLFDPYVTTRKGGTGLGLAIVRKVMDEHEGQVRLLRRPEGGTAVELTFTPNPTAPRDKAELQGVGAHEPEPPTGQIRGIDR